MLPYTALAGSEHDFQRGLCPWENGQHHRQRFASQQCSELSDHDRPERHRSPAAPATALGHPPSASFGNVGVGTRNTYAFTLTNSGSANVSSSQAHISGSSLSPVALCSSLTLTPGQKSNFSV